MTSASTSTHWVRYLLVYLFYKEIGSCSNSRGTIAEISGEEELSLPGDNTSLFTLLDK